MIGLGLAASLLLQAPAPPPDHAWPVFRGGVGVASHAKAPLTWSGKTGENIRWKAAVPKPSSGSPIVWKNRVFLTGSDAESREVYSFDAETGRLLWRQALKSGPLPKLIDGVTHADATLATDGERVYAVLATGDVAAFALDGKPAWTRSLGAPRNVYGHASSPVVWPGRVIVPLDDQRGGRLVALDAATGETAWEQKRDVKESWATPIVVHTGARWELVLFGLPAVSAHDPATGKLLWSLKVMDNAEPAPSPAFAGGTVFVVTEHAPMTAVKPGDAPRIAWQLEEGQFPDISSPVAAGKHVFMATSTGVVTCLDAATGKTAWTKEFDEGFSSSPIVVGDRVYLTDREGVTLVFRAGDRYEPLARNELGGKVACTPAFPAGRIFIRTERHLYCIGS